MAKYDSLRKNKRNQAIVEYAKAHPELAQWEIGRKYHIGQSVVSRVLKKHRAK